MQPSPGVAVGKWLAQACGLGVLYFGFARVALLLAVPPGYASPVWPAAGIALGALLVYGYRQWPGIFVGSYLVSATYLLAPAEYSAAPPAAAAGIAVGATLQAVLAALLARRWVGFPIDLDRPLSFLAGTLIAGPLVCVVSATIGVGALLVSGRMTAESTLNSWATWWLGDTLGVLLVFPVLSVWVMRLSNTRARIRLLVGVPLLIGTLLIVVLFLDARRAERDNASAEFQRRATIMARALQQSGEANLALVASIATVFSGSTTIDRQEFRDFVRPLFDHRAGLRALGFSPRISAARRPEYERAARQDGFPDFEITERDPGGRMIRASSRGEYVAIYYIEPFESNEAALGFDLASDPTRAPVLERSRDTGRILATPSIRLVQDAVEEDCFLVIAPIYDRKRTLDTVAARRASLQGYASAAYCSRELVEDALQAFDSEGIGYRVVDASTPGRHRQLYPGIRGVPALPSADRSPGWSASLELGGRTWVIDFWPTAGYETSRVTVRPLAVLGGGLFFTSMLGGFLLVLAGRAATIERVVEKRTAELSQANAELSREVAERIRAERLLHEAHREREEAQVRFSHNIVEAQEEERRILAQELHDGVAQELAAVSILAQMEAGKFEGEPARGFDRLYAALRHSVAELRRLSYGLHPLELEQRGLEGAVAELIERARAASPDVVFHFEGVAGGVLSLGDQQELGVFRTVQESLSNALRHAHARNVWITHSHDGGSLVVEVRDDGIGFDPHERSAGMGLRSMRQRAEILDAALTIHADASGTRVTLVVPIADRQP